MRRLAIALGLVFGFLLLLPSGSTALTLPTGPAVFFTPHQDDETLSMGASIVQHVRAGRTVYVVLLTTGQNSWVHTLYPSTEVFIAERDREFVAAVKAMGAIPVIPAERAVDGQLTVAFAESVMQQWIAKYPDGSFKTMSETDAHPDHAAAGQALRATGVVDARWYVKRTEWATNPKGGFTAYENLQTPFLAYAPVGWLSVNSEFQFGFIQSRDRYYTP